METTAVILLSIMCLICVLTVSFVAIFAFKITNSLIRIGELRQKVPADSSPPTPQTDDNEDFGYEEGDAETYININKEETAQPAPQTAQPAPQAVQAGQAVQDGQAPQTAQTEEYAPEDDEPQEEEQPEDKGKVVSFTAVKKTLDDKYNALSEAQKSLYDETAAYASGKQFIHRFKNNKYEEFKMGYNSVVKLVIRRKSVFCEFALVNDELNDFLVSNNLTVANGVAVLEIKNDATLLTVKSCIDVSYEEVCKERLKKSEARRVAT